MNSKINIDKQKQPLNIYEVHLSSFLRHSGGANYTYTEIAEPLARYLNDMEYTHVELMPITEYPLDNSWGYQVTGYFAPTSRYGTPNEFKYLVDTLHNYGIGVILDWVPAHFPKDEHGLYMFDGTPTYEYADTTKQEIKDWGTAVFDFGKGEVQSFLISSALYFIEEYHIDGLRVDAVSSMLYLDYSRGYGEWQPNIYGGNYNLEAISFLQKLNNAIHSRYPSTIMIAEESTAFPKITHSISDDGLGFDFKWNMGWMHDTLSYIAIDPYFRKYHHDKLTFPMMYAFAENYILAISHDEVVHQKSTLSRKMYGDNLLQMAGTRALLGYMMSYSGKKHLFMGQEFGEIQEFNEYKEINWYLLNDTSHKSCLELSKKLNHIYRTTPALYELDGSWSGFEWLVVDEKDKNLVAYIRKARDGKNLISITNFSNVNIERYRLGVDTAGEYIEILNTDSIEFAGSGYINKDTIIARDIPSHNKQYSIEINIAKMSTVYIVIRE